MSDITASFVISAASADDFPATGIPEIAMVGRSNVGKSTLINALARVTIARASAAPGKTRLANYYLLEPRKSTQGWSRFYLVDLPGYGYARGGGDAAREFQTLTREYFDVAARPHRRMAGVLQVIDARHPDLESDAAAHTWVLRQNVPAAIVANKIDKLKQSERSKNLAALEESYDATIVPVSAVDGSGVEAIMKLIVGWLSSS